MKITTLFTGLLSLAFTTLLHAETAEERDLTAEFGEHSGSFVLYDAARDHWVRFHPAQCRERTSPCSTFKIPNSLIFLETGVVTGPDVTVKWDGQRRPIEEWNRDQTLRSAIAVSCVWYYQMHAALVGMERYQQIMPKLAYGNGDLSGGVTQFWLESSLKISPDEQVGFLRRMHARQLPFAAKHVDTVLDIMKLAERGDRTFRGKTGTGGSLATNTANLGWFVGSVTTPKGDYYFATRLTAGKNPSGRTARKITETILAKLEILPEQK